MPVSVVGVNISKTGNYTILITVSLETDVTDYYTGTRGSRPQVIFIYSQKDTLTLAQ
ncbi:hypothetical protein GXU08_004431 [Escherichia coli]|nr:hypothetical protein [Escherichia coli]